MNNRLLILSISILLLVGACSVFKTATPTVLPPTLTPPHIITVAPTPTNNGIPLPTIAPTSSPAISQPDYSTLIYLDDRSTPATLLYSMANAFTRHEFIRVYSYWSDPMAYLGTLDAFSANYQELVSMQISIGNIYGEGAAGSIYYLAPAVITINNTDGSINRLSACFTMKLPQPANFGAPPIDPLHIEQSKLVVYAAGLSDGELMSKACDGMGENGNMGLGNPPIALELENLADLSNQNYIDNRSGAVEVVSSLFNALNRREYVRAYSYWQDPTITPGDFDSYAAGFSDTDVITAVFGSVISDAGAGQWYYQVPVAQIVRTTTGGTQTFVGCYTLHLSNPAFQGTLPFEPMGIKEGHFETVPNGTDVVPLLTAACT